MFVFLFNLITGILCLLGPTKLNGFVGGWCLGIAFILFMFHMGVGPADSILDFMNVVIK
jgi:hypothetical protein